MKTRHADVLSFYFTGKGLSLIVNVSEPVENAYFYTDSIALRSAEMEEKAVISFCHQRSFRAKDGSHDTSFLHDLEQGYYSKLEFERRKASYLLGRYAAKTAVAVLANVPDPREIGIGNGVFQQPVVRCPSPNVQASISHSHEWGAALAFSEGIMAGIDIERRESKHKTVFENQLSQGEQQLSARLPDPEDGALLLWTVKESLSKALKTGFTVPAELFEVQCIEAGESCYISSFVHFPIYKALSFWLEDYRCSITYPGNVELSIDINRLRRRFASIQNQNRLLIGKEDR
ncbi:4'-phosphopantetheinyl transferase family protein [Paenibacillus kobensis]|uniref:4'-phosphopantetheinyl transferase family protein n=1 Tax=Paenibacillus kobensis TaxID=59841 RepID=UPI0013E380E3|nr:4'-phosphopantetheinyl transferase superfamily protein [Paenibacillus kobensis]